MIEKRIFPGISLARRKTRRRLVVGYWAFVLLLVGCASPIVFKHPTVFGVRAWVCINLIVGLTGFLGGNDRGGAVRAFQGRTAGERRTPPDYSFMTVEDVAAKIVAKEQAEKECRLDERDTNLRNAAHFKAYVFMRKSAFFVIFALIALGIPRLSRLEFLREPLLWLLLVVFLSLPQTLILWTEPDMEAPE